MRDLHKCWTACLLLLCCGMCVTVPVPGQEMEAAMVYLAGASCEEELTETETERYEALLSHPLELNRASRSRLSASGLLSPYQIASLQDYRSRSGDVLSVAELALVDGFGADFARAVAPFVSFRSDRLPGVLPDDTLRVRQYLLAKAALRRDTFTAWHYGLKYRLDLGGCFETALAARSSYGADPWPPQTYSLNMILHGRGRLGKIVLGDFSTRFGQGLALWSGMQMTGFSSSASFVRRPSGISPSWSWTGIGTHRGAAADFGFGRFVLSAFLSLPGLRDRCERRKSPGVSVLPGMNLSWYGRNGQIGVTSYGRFVAGGALPSGKVSADFRYSRRGIDSFGECAWDFVHAAVAAVAGASLPAGGDFRLLGLLRYYPAVFAPEYAGAARAGTKSADEYGVALGLERGPAVLSADYSCKASDAARNQLKLLLKWPQQLSPAAVLTFRATERIRPGELLRYRTDLRADLDWFSGGLDARYGASSERGWSARLRGECLICRSAGLLTYLDAGRKAGNWSACLRTTFFRIDSWDDRIYSYERNAPGNFTVPAYCGRGYSLAAAGGCKLRLTRDWKTLRLYLRACRTGYFRNRKDKSGKTELVFQLVAEL